MSKKITVLALAVVSAALFALPAVVSAQTWHIDTAVSFSISGSGGTLTSTSGNVVCSSTSGSGRFSTTTEGEATVNFSGCNALGLFNCTSPGAAAGTITLSNKFDGIMLATNKPGVLLTPKGTEEPTPISLPSWKEFSHFTCVSLTVKPFGKGAIGTVTQPACGTASNTATLTFLSSATGVQEHQSYTGNPFDLKSTISSSHPTASLDGSVVMTFASSHTITCTHTSVIG